MNKMSSLQKLMLNTSNRCKFINYQKRYSSNQLKKSSINYQWLMIIPVTTFGLGTWQVRRLQWKKEKIADLERRTQSEPVPLPPDIFSPGKMKEMEYKSVSVDGYFDHSNEIYIGPRSLNTDGQKGGAGGGGGGLVGLKPTSGYHVITPFVLDNGERILVNRGWVSKDKKYPETRQEGQITGRIHLSGLLRCGEARPQFTPKVNDNSRDWHYLDVDRFSQILDTLPLILDADRRININNGPLGGQTKVTLRNEHMQYIITWYSLCVLTAYMYYKLRKNPNAMFSGGSKKLKY